MIHTYYGTKVQYATINITVIWHYVPGTAVLVSYSILLSGTNQQGILLTLTLRRGPFVLFHYYISYTGIPGILCLALRLCPPFWSLVSSLAHQLDITGRPGGLVVTLEYYCVGPGI